MPRLVITTPDGLQTDVQLDELFFTVGRSSSCTLQINDRGLSKRHARFYRTDQGYIAVDAESKNGVRINGEKVAKALMREGDLILLGKVRIEWHDDPATAPAAAPAPEVIRPDDGIGRRRDDRPAAAAPLGGPRGRVVPTSRPQEASDGIGRPAVKTASPERPAGPAPSPVATDGIGQPAVKAVGPEMPAAPGTSPVATDGIGQPAVKAAGPAEGPSTEEVEALLALLPDADDDRLPGLKPVADSDVDAPPPRRAAPPRRPRSRPAAVPLALVDPADDEVVVLEEEPLPPAEAPGAVLPDDDDTIEQAMARLLAEVPAPADASARFAVPERVRQMVERIGRVTLVACSGGLVVLAALVAHARHATQARWEDGLALAGLEPATGADAQEDPAERLYGEAVARAATDPAASRSMLEQLVRSFSASGYADLARARLEREPPPKGPTTGPVDEAVRRLEEALASGRPREALEGYALLARSAVDDDARARFAQRRRQIESTLWSAYAQRAQELDTLRADGKTREAAALAVKLLGAYPLDRVRKDLEARLSRPANPTPANPTPGTTPRPPSSARQLCRQVRDHCAAGRYLQARTAVDQATGLPAERRRDLARLVDLERALHAAVDARLKARPASLGPGLAWALGTTTARCAGLREGRIWLREPDGRARSVPLEKLEPRHRYALLKDNLPRDRAAQGYLGLAGMAALRGWPAERDVALQLARNLDPALRDAADWVVPLADWYRTTLQ